MPDILDDLRAELDAAFARAEAAAGVQRPRRRRRVGSAGAHRPWRGLTILAPFTAAAVAFTVFVAPALDRERIPADERPASSHTTPPSFDAYGPVEARVYARSSSGGDRQVTIDKGLDDGVHRGDPVIDGAGLVGKVAKSTGGSSDVTLITDQRFGTSAYVGQDRHVGSIATAVGSSGDLLFEPVDASASVRENELVYTAGTTDPALESRYPRAVPVGRVHRIDLGGSDLDRRIYVRPVADLVRLDVVQVLTDPHPD